MNIENKICLHLLLSNFFFEAAYFPFCIFPHVDRQANARIVQQDYCLL